MNDHFVLLSGPATCGNMAPWMSEAELAGFSRHTAYLHWKMWKWAGSQTWCHLGCTRNGFWQKLGQVTASKVWKFWWRSSRPFCQAILNSWTTFPTPQFPKNFQKALGMVMEAYVKKLIAAVIPCFGTPVRKDIQWFRSTDGFMAPWALQTVHPVVVGM